VQLFTLHRQANKYHFSNDVNQWTEFSTDVEEIQNPDDKNGDDETVENASIGNESRDETDDETGEEKYDDDGVGNVPQVGVEHAKLLTELGRLTDKELTRKEQTEMLHLYIILPYIWAGLRHVQGVWPNRAADFRRAATLDPTNSI